MQIAIPQDYQSAAIVLFGVTTLVIAVNAIIGIYNGLRPRRQLDQEVQSFIQEALKAFATRDDLKTLERRYDETFREIFDSQRQQMSSVAKILQDMDRSLGRVEGKLERCPGPAKCARE